MFGPKMKINQSRCLESIGPYNEVYEAFEPLFLSVFQQRTVYSQQVGLEWYERMPKLEKRLLDFVASGTSDIGLLVGPIGIGKSSALRYLTHSGWNGLPGTETILIDLSRKKAALSVLELPAEFRTASAVSQKHESEARIATCLAAEIEGHISTQVDFAAEIDELYDFFVENNKDLLMPEGFFNPSDLETRRAILSAVQSRHRLAFLFVCLKYYGIKRSLQRLVLVIDNCDQKDPVLIESFVDSLCHLDRCFENIKGSYDSFPILTALVSCRPATRWLLESESNKNALGSHGWRAISLDTPCALAALLRRRTKAFAPGTDLRQMRITSRNGITWEVDRPERFLGKLAESLEAHGHGTMLGALCNWNMADAMVALCDVLSNKHYIDLDRVIGDVVPEHEHPNIGIPWTSILRALAYGSPSGTPIYPVRNTRVPNVLSGTVSALPKTLLKPRLLEWLLKHASGEHANTAAIIELFTSCFAITSADLLLQCDELYSEGLVETHRGYTPSQCGHDCGLQCTPRAAQLWQDLSMHDVLLCCYRDDFYLGDHLSWTKTPTSQLQLAERCLVVLELCEWIFEAERRELLNIVQRIGGVAFVNEFGESLISEHLVLGFSSALYTFYQRYVSDLPESWSLESRLRDLDSKCQALKAKCFTEPTMTDAG